MAKYGKGHYVQEGTPFQLTAIGKKDGPKGKEIKVEVACVCPYCEVRNKYVL